MLEPFQYINIDFSFCFLFFCVQNIHILFCFNKHWRKFGSETKCTHTHTHKRCFMQMFFYFVFLLLLFYDMLKYFLNAILMTWMHLSICVYVCVRAEGTWKIEGSRVKIRHRCVLIASMLLFSFTIRCVKHPIHIFFLSFIFLSLFLNILCCVNRRSKENNGSRKKTHTKSARERERVRENSWTSYS